MTRIIDRLKAVAMNTLSILFIIGLGLISSPAPALADEVSKNAKIEEMMQISHADQMMTQLLDQMKTMAAAQVDKAGGSQEARAQAHEIQQKMMALIASRLSWDKAKPAFIKVYADTFTEGEIDGIVAFYKSPAGRAMLQKMPELTQKSMAVSQQLMGDIMPEIKRMSEEMMKQPDNKQ